MSIKNRENIARTEISPGGEKEVPSNTYEKILCFEFIPEHVQESLPFWAPRISVTEALLPSSLGVHEPRDFTGLAIKS